MIESLVDTPQEEISQDKLPMATGNFLRSVRIKKQLSETDIEKRLNIKKRIICAIEDHEYKKLPDTVTATALVRQYAKFLGLDAKKLGDDYKKEMEGTDQKIEVVFPNRLPPSFKPFRNALPITLAILGIYFVWQYINDIDGMMPVVQPASEIIADISADSLGIELSENLENNFVIEPEIHFEVIRKPEILLKADGGDSWIEIKNTTNQQIIYSAILKDGQTFKIPNDVSGLRLKAGNSSPLHIIINDKELDIMPNDSRVLRDFNLDSDRLLEYYKSQN